MRIAVYNEPMGGGGIGGAEYCALVLAEALGRHQVEVVHHDRQFSPDQLAQSFAADLPETAFRYVPRDDNWRQIGTNLFTGDLARRQWRREVSAGRDWLITICHGMPPFCHARQGVLYVLFPAFARRDVWPWVATSLPAGPIKRLYRQARNLYHERLWRQRLASYSRIATISEYSRRWCRDWWGLEAEVIYPPVDTAIEPAPKQPRIAAVGRFAELKCQAVMLDSFKRLSAGGLGGWRFACYGNPAERDYYRQIQEAAAGQPIDLISGASRSELTRGLAESQIFWHAMGYGCDERTQPDRLEHFGIATVEAMAAGAVPVVINKGGQREIVEHGVSGFLWDTAVELETYTRRLIENPALQQAMSRAARQRAQHFSKERFAEQFAQIIDQEPGQAIAPRRARGPQRATLPAVPELVTNAE